MQAFSWRHLMVAAGAVALLAQPAAASLSSQEAKCASTLSKSLEKLNAAILKEVSRCRAGDISGNVDDDDACATLPAKAQAKIDGAKEKMIAAVGKACRSVCNLSDDKVCINDVTCPPNNDNAERCSGKGGGNPFEVGNLGFPGPYCEAILSSELGRTRLVAPTDIGLCTADLATVMAGYVINSLYADLDESSSVSDDAQGCLAAITKATSKSISKMHAAVARCRTTREDQPVCDGGTNAGNSCNNDANCTGGGVCGLDPDSCASDPDVAALLQKAQDAITGAIAKTCSDSEIAELDGLCAAGGTVPVSVADAQECVVDMAMEIAALHSGPFAHTYAPFGMINISHPPSAFGYCGDGLIDQPRNESNRIGEECDGDNDAACGSGSCLPPGDLFECTCDNIPRYRMVIDGQSVDSDAGWTGDSHDATHNDNFGYTADLDSCNCSDFDQASCVGTSSDPVCGLDADIGPRCSNDRDSSLTCDQVGNNDGSIEDSDCFVCDENSLNAGTYCADGGEADEGACDSQCFDDATGLPTTPVTPCGRQADCGEGETCKGRCDDTPTCERQLEGSPLPLVSAGISICIGLEYTSDLTGTKNMATGEAELFYTSRSVVFLGETATRPCPTCGGSCVGGDDDGEGCFGTCNSSGDPCLFDADCTAPGDTTCGEAQASCDSGTCSLDLRCSSGNNAGQFCRPMANTPLGTVSADCPPSNSDNLSGLGVQQPFGAVTTAVRQFPAGGACSDPGWSNFNCPCPDGGTAASVKTKPNTCAATCNGGVNEGLPCAVQANSTGTMTKCVGGAENGAICDEDADCSGGGTCTGNPKQCTAGAPVAIGGLCTTNAQCDTSLGSADGVCADACPGAKCLPLCYPQGECTGGPRDGLECATSLQCAGFPCDPTDPEDGLCASGPLKWRCTGVGYETLACPFTADGTQTGCEAGEDGTLGNSDDIPGAGLCQSRPLDCYINNGMAEGGTTLNGLGDASNVKLVSTFCTPPSGSSAVNGVSGFGGPSRTRRVGQGYVNVPSIP